MKAILFTLLVLVHCACSPIKSAASETEFPEFEEQSLFSPGFLAVVSNAARAEDPVARLEELHKTLKNPAEQAEVELALARILCSRTGMVDPAKSILWYDKALVRNLPTVTLARQFILRGNMHERLGHIQEALADYVRGVLICSQFNLPSIWPDHDSTGKLQPPPLDNSVNVEPEAGRDAKHRMADQQRSADYRIEAQAIRRDQDLLMSRYYYIEAIKRVQEHAKLSASDLQTTTEKLTNRKDRVEEILRRVREPNPRPWP